MLNMMSYVMLKYDDDDDISYEFFVDHDNISEIDLSMTTSTVSPLLIGCSLTPTPMRLNVQSARTPQPIRWNNVQSARANKLSPLERQKTELNHFEGKICCWGASTKDTPHSPFLEDVLSECSLVYWHFYDREHRKMLELEF